MSKLKVIVKEPGKDFELREIEEGLEPKQKIVGGLIEYIAWFIDDDELVCYGNEEGKINGMKPNFAYIHEGDIWDVVAGPVLFVRSNDKGGDVDVLDSDLEVLRKRLKERTLIAPASMSSDDYCEVLLNKKEVYFRWPLF